MSAYINDIFIHLSRQMGFSLSETTTNTIVQLFKKVSLKKGDFLLKEGQYCTQVALVEEGLLMYYHIADGEEVARDFAIENDWASYIKSTSQNIPSDINIRALEDCELHVLNIETMQLFFQEHPEFIQIRMKIMEQSFMEIAEYNTNLNGLSPEEHYKKLVQTKSDWLQRVPQYYIASYLGIKPQSLSRIRKRISDL